MQLSAKHSSVSSVDRPDSLYVVKSASGGKVTPEESTLTAQSPVLILEPNRADYRPIFDGKPLKATNGVYRVTVSEAGEHTVEWEEIPVDKPQVYTVDGCALCIFVG